MQYRRLGNSELEVSIIGLGGTTFGPHTTYTHYNDQDGSAVIIDRAHDLGINLIDTADMYGDGVSESFIGKAISGRRDRFILASKVGIPRSDGPTEELLSRSHIISSIEGSLRRLDTDYIDLYYAHAPDPVTPIEETLHALEQLVSQGKVRYVGCSNYAAWELCEAIWTSRTKNLVSFSTVQPRYSMLDREI